MTVTATITRSQYNATPPLMRAAAVKGKILIDDPVPETIDAFMLESNGKLLSRAEFDALTPSERDIFVVGGMRAVRR